MSLFYLFFETPEFTGSWRLPGLFDFYAGKFISFD